VIASSKNSPLYLVFSSLKQNLGIHTSSLHLLYRIFREKDNIFFDVNKNFFEGF